MENEKWKMLALLLLFALQIPQGAIADALDRLRFEELAYLRVAREQLIFANSIFPGIGDVFDLVAFGRSVNVEFGHARLQLIKHPFPIVANGLVFIAPAVNQVIGIEDAIFVQLPALMGATGGRQHLL